MAVKAMQQGAMTFLEKPFRDQELLDSIQDALDRDVKNSQQAELYETAKQRQATLTPRENEILERIVAGDSSRIIGETYGISVKTVEVHRSHIMEKMQAKNLPELVQMVLSLRAVSVEVI
jgi:FixJ family two-component response regulator